jgi:Fic family protein
MISIMDSADVLLSGTPYLIENDEASLDRLERARARANKTRDKSIRTNQRIRSEAEGILGPYLDATRMDLVTQSNLIEGMAWSPKDVRAVVSTHRTLLDGPVHSLTETVRSDPKLYEVLGLYRAHEIADIWLDEKHVPRAADIRALHRLILGAVRGSGSFKQFANQIAGRPDHKTTEPQEVPRVMLDMADWWASSSGDPLLTATAIHAWLAHVHPFEDGNGRIARILANVELARHSYPPLILRAADDRGQYYASLQASDDGDLLPLFELFERAVRRQAKILARPSYVQDVINDRLLSSDSQRYQLWQATLHQFSQAMSDACGRVGLVFAQQGSLSPEAFSLLGERDSDGNGWYATIARRGKPEWLLYFGYRSDEWLDVSDVKDEYPSIFISRRDRSSNARHPYTSDYARSDLDGDLPDEIHLMPAQAAPVSFRNRYDVLDLKIDKAAEQLTSVLSSAPSLS